MLFERCRSFDSRGETVMLTDLEFLTLLQQSLLYFSPASLTVIFIFICVGIFMRYTKYGKRFMLLAEPVKRL